MNEASRPGAPGHVKRSYGFSETPEAGPACEHPEAHPSDVHAVKCRRRSFTIREDELFALTRKSDLIAKPRFLRHMPCCPTAVAGSLNHKDCELSANALLALPLP